MILFQYVTNQATRIIVRAIGELASEAGRVDADEDKSGMEEEEEENDTSTTISVVHNLPFKKEEIDYKIYKPNVVGDDWIVSETDLCTDFFFSNGNIY